VPISHASLADVIDLILVARRLDRLESLAEKLSERFGVPSRRSHWDLSQPAVGATSPQSRTTGGLPVTSLITNAVSALTGIPP